MRMKKDTHYVTAYTIDGFIMLYAFEKEKDALSFIRDSWFENNVIAHFNTYEAHMALVDSTKKEDNIQ